MAETGDWSQYRVTRAGRELRQYCLAHGIKPVFTKATIGEGIPEKPSDIDTMTGLVSYAADVIIKKSYAIEENHLHIVRVDNSGYKQDILMTEVSTWIRREDQEDSEAILYGYAYNLDGYVKVPRQSNVTSRKIFEITLDTALSATTEIQIIYDESSLWVSHADLDDLLGSWFATEYIATVEHGLQALPIAALYPTADAYGMSGYGDAGYGGDVDAGIPVKLHPVDWNTSRVFTSARFAGEYTVNKLTRNLYALSQEGSSTTLTLVLR